MKIFGRVIQNMNDILVVHVKTSFKPNDIIELLFHKPKRSLNANAYMWQLLSQMAIALRSTSEEVYDKMLNRYGVEMFITVPEVELPKLKAVFKIVEDKGISEYGRHTYRCVIGSSCYDSTQMSRLIDGIVDEAKELGIETLTPRELYQMGIKLK